MIGFNMSRFEQQIFEYLSLVSRRVQSAPLMLGAGQGSGGGVGGRPGGYVGYLPQTRVAYDMSELAINTVPTSGSLLDNLNRIRYRLTVLEGNITVLNSGVLVASGVHTINFVGASVTNDGGGVVTVVFP